MWKRFNIYIRSLATLNQPRFLNATIAEKAEVLGLDFLDLSSVVRHPWMAGKNSRSEVVSRLYPRTLCKGVGIRSNPVYGEPTIS